MKENHWKDNNDPNDSKNTEPWKKIKEDPFPCCPTLSISPTISHEWMQSHVFSFTAMFTVLRSFSPHLSKPAQNPISNSYISPIFHVNSSRRLLIFTTSISLSSTLSLALQWPGVPLWASADSSTSPSPSPSSFLSGIANTKSWFQFYGNGFAIRVPPQFEDITEPDVCSFLLWNILFECGFWFKLIKKKLWLALSWNGRI